MDKLDKYSILAIVLLVAGAAALVIDHAGGPGPGRTAQLKAVAPGGAADGSEAEGLIRTARNLLEGGSLDKASALVNELVLKYPYEAGPHMLLGDIFMRKQDPVKAIFEYKEAIELNPDYLDRKTPLFQGKKLKVVVGEALAVVENRLKAEPGNELLKKHRKDIYYLQRRIAGSCG